MTRYTWSYLHHFKAGQIFRAAVIWKPNMVSADKQAWLPRDLGPSNVCGSWRSFFNCLVHRCDTTERIIELVSIYGRIKAHIFMFGGYPQHSLNLERFEKEKYGCHRGLWDDVTSHSRTDFQLTFIWTLHLWVPRAKAHRERNLIKETRLSRSQSSFSTSCKKLKLKTDRISSPRSMQQMKTTTLNCISYQPLFSIHVLCIHREHTTTRVQSCGSSVHVHYRRRLCCFCGILGGGGS